MTLGSCPRRRPFSVLILSAREEFTQWKVHQRPWWRTVGTLLLVFHAGWKESSQHPGREGLRMKRFGLYFCALLYALGPT